MTRHDATPNIDGSWPVSEYTDKLLASTREQLIGEVLRLRGDLATAEHERDAMRESLMHACELSRDTMENHRELWAIRQTANWKGAPFSHSRVEEKYAEYPQAVDEITKDRDSLRSLLAETIGIAKSLAWKLHRECPNDMDETEHPNTIKRLAELAKLGGVE